MKTLKKLFVLALVLSFVLYQCSKSNEQVVGQEEMLYNMYEPVGSGVEIPIESSSLKFDLKDQEDVTLKKINYINGNDWNVDFEHSFEQDTVFKIAGRVYMYTKAKVNLHREGKLASYCQIPGNDSKISLPEGVDYLAGKWVMVISLNGRPWEVNIHPDVLKETTLTDISGRTYKYKKALLM